MKSLAKYHDMILTHKHHMIPPRPLQKNSAAYDVKCSPADYSYPIMYINRLIEQKNGRTFHVFPLKDSAIPSHYRIDT